MLDRIQGWFAHGRRGPRLHAGLARFETFATFSCDGRLGAGELTLELDLEVRAGTWRALYLDEDGVDTLTDEGALDEDDRRPTQLLLLHESASPPAGTSLRGLRSAGAFPIEGARFTIADLGVRAALAAADGFYRHLDGVHGPLANGRGVHVVLMGDGEAELWVEDRADPTLVFVSLG